VAFRSLMQRHKVKLLSFRITRIELLVFLGLVMIFSLVDRKIAIFFVMTSDKRMYSENMKAIRMKSAGLNGHLINKR
jgi:hypothetical protein